MATPPTQSRTSGRFIAVVALLLGVIVTSIVSPATNGDGRDVSAAGPPTGLGGSSEPGAAGDGTTQDDASAGAGPDAPGDETGRRVGPAGPGGPSGAGPATQPGGTSGGDGTSTGSAGGESGRGIDGDTIKIGLAVAEAGAIEAVARIGDTEGHVRSVVDGWHADGLVPVHGRKVEVVVRTFDLLSEAEQRAACVSFAQDDEVFMVMAPLVFVVGAECLAREFQIPVIASAGAVPGDDWFARTHPYGFYTNMSDTRVGVNFVHWAHHQGLLKGKRIGLNYEDDPILSERVRVAVKATLAELGYEIALDFPSPEGAEALVVQRFISERIDLAMVMGGGQTGPRAADFTQAAQVQGYKPTYVLSEFLNTATLAPGFADGFHPDQADGMKAMTYYKRAEDGRFGNPPIPAAGTACEVQYESFSGRQIDRFENSNEWDALQHACDQGRATITALAAAGPRLTQLGFTQAMETSVKNQASGEVADIGFSPTKHDGANQIKTMRWARSCSCWLHHSPYRPLFG